MESQQTTPAFDMDGLLSEVRELRRDIRRNDHIMNVLKARELMHIIDSYLTVVRNKYCRQSSYSRFLLESMDHPAIPEPIQDLLVDVLVERSRLSEESCLREPRPSYMSSNTMLMIAEACGVNAQYPYNEMIEYVDKLQYLSDEN